MSNDITFNSACQVLETTFKGNLRREIVTDLLKAKSFKDSLSRLREAMRAHVFKAGKNQLQLDKIVRKFDNLTRQDGFNVLRDWDGKADKLNTDIIPIDVLNYM